MEQKYKVFCDMDGILTDFNRGYKELTGIDISGTFHDNPEFWEPIEKKGYDFWINLHWTKDGKKLWDYIKKYNPEVLSSPSKQNDSRVGKHDWIEKELPGVHLILRSAGNKKEFAKPDSILIDDMEKNVESWKKAGGIGILHKSADDTIEQLKKLSL
jgi:5'(3')-deoxyribonucleotidase